MIIAIVYIVISVIIPLIILLNGELAAAIVSFIIFISASPAVWLIYVVGKYYKKKHINSKYSMISTKIPTYEVGKTRDDLFVLIYKEYAVQVEWNDEHTDIIYNVHPNSMINYYKMDIDGIADVVEQYKRVNSIFSTNERNSKFDLLFKEIELYNTNESDKKAKEYKRLLGVKDVIPIIIDILDKDIEYYSKKLFEVSALIKMVQNSTIHEDNKAIYLKYKILLDNILKEVFTLKDKYLLYIKEIFISYEIEEYDLRQEVEDVDINKAVYIEVKKQIERLFEEYKEYKMAYNELEEEYMKLK